MNKDTQADCGRPAKAVDGAGAGSIQGRYYPVKGGSSSNWNKTNSPWRPTASGTEVSRESNRGTRRNFAQGGGQFGSGGTRSSPKTSDSLYGPGLAPRTGALGPDGSGGGTTHTRSDWFARNKNNTGSGSGDMPGGKTSNSNAGGLSDTTPYGSSDHGSGKGQGNAGKLRRQP